MVVVVSASPMSGGATAAARLLVTRIPLKLQVWHNLPISALLATLVLLSMRHGFQMIIQGLHRIFSVFL